MLNQKCCFVWLYRNGGVWNAKPELWSCMTAQEWWRLILSFEKLKPKLLSCMTAQEWWRLILSLEMLKPKQLSCMTAQEWWRLILSWQNADRKCVACVQDYPRGRVHLGRQQAVQARGVQQHYTVSRGHHPGHGHAQHTLWRQRERGESAPVLRLYISVCLIVSLTRSLLFFFSFLFKVFSHKWS